LIPPTVTDASTHGPSVCLPVTFMHPAKAIGRNEIAFCRDTCVAPSNTVLDGVLVPHGKGRFGFGGSKPPICHDQSATMNRKQTPLLALATFPPEGREGCYARRCKAEGDDHGKNRCTAA